MSDAAYATLLTQMDDIRDEAVSKLLRTETVGPSETISGHVWIDPTGPGDWKHFVIEVPWGETARFEFGDPSYVSDLCRPEAYPYRAVIGWVNVHGLRSAPKVGQTVNSDVGRYPEVYESPDPDAKVVCTLPHGWAISVRAPAEKHKGTGVWVPLTGEGD